MRQIRIAMVLTVILFSLIGCGSPPIKDTLVQARLTNFSVEKGSDLILSLSEPVNINMQIEARLLLPDAPIWKRGEKLEKSENFPAYKYEILLHDIKPYAQKKFTELITVLGDGPITKVEGVYPPDDSLYAIYLGIGDMPLKIRIKDLGKSKVLISVY